MAFNMMGGMPNLQVEEPKTPVRCMDFDRLFDRCQRPRRAATLKSLFSRYAAMLVAAKMGDVRGQVPEGARARPSWR